jgi:hypothetical protein
MLTAALADRARQIDEGERATLGHGAFVATLTAMLTAALSASAASQSRMSHNATNTAG